MTYAVDLIGIGALVSGVGAALAVIVGYVRGGKDTKAQTDASAALRMSEDTKHQLDNQQRYIDQLQEDILGYRVELEKKVAYADTLAAQVAKLREDLANSNAELAGARRTILALEAFAKTLEEQVKALREMVDSHMGTIRAHERTIEMLRMESR